LANHHPQIHSRRELGRTGVVSSFLGIGDLADRNLPLETRVATARRAIDARLALIVTAPRYEDGNSEEIVGRLVKVVRNQTFIIAKFDELDELRGRTPL